MDGWIQSFVQCEYFKANIEITQYWQLFNSWTKAVPSLSSLILSILFDHSSPGHVSEGQGHAVHFESCGFSFAAPSDLAGAQIIHLLWERERFTSCGRFLKSGLMWPLCSAPAQVAWNGSPVFKIQPCARSCFLASGSSDVSRNSSTEITPPTLRYMNFIYRHTSIPLEWALDK